MRRLAFFLIVGWFLAIVLATASHAWKPKPCDHPEVQRCCAEPSMPKCADRPWAEAVARCCEEPPPPEPCPSPCPIVPPCPACPACPACPDPTPSVRLCQVTTITGRVRCKPNRQDPQVQDCRARGKFWRRDDVLPCDGAQAGD